MTATLLLEQFEHLIVTPADVELLNRAILTLAVQGRLVEQDPNDEPASEILKRIQKKNAKNPLRLRALPAVSDEKKPFSIPATWVWTRLGEITNYGNSERTKGSNFTDETWVLDLEDIEKVTSRLLQRVSYKERKFQSDKNVFQKGDVIYGKLRPYLDKVIVAEEDGVCSSELIPIKTYGEIDPHYLRVTLKRPDFIEYVNQKTYGVKMPRLGTQDAQIALIPLPPLAEQKRIVACVEQLFAQTRALAEKLDHAENALASLTQSALARLLSSGTPEEFQKHWNFIATHFESLFTRPEHVAPLRQSILELAVRGKLTRREPDDEPARVMLGRIRKEKKERGMKEVIAPFKESEKPFPLPEGWEWTTLGFISKKIHYGYTESADFTIKNYRLLRITDIQDSKVNWSHVPGCAIDEQEADKYLLHDDDILIARTGGTIGKSYLVKKLEVKAVFASYLIRVQKCNEINANYLKIFLDSPLYWQQLFEKSKGTGQPNVNATSLSQLILPMPSLAEQVRILAQVETLLGLCEALESRLRTAKEERSRLVESVLAGVRS